MVSYPPRVNPAILKRAPVIIGTLVSGDHVQIINKLVASPVSVAEDKLYRMDIVIVIQSQQQCRAVIVRPTHGRLILGALAVRVVAGVHKLV